MLFPSSLPWQVTSAFALQELYSEVQTQYLPQLLGCLLQPLAEEVETLSLPELTHALKTCFKVLSKVQMPPSYLDMAPSSGNSVCGPGPRPFRASRRGR